MAVVRYSARLGSKASEKDPLTKSHAFRTDFSCVISMHMVPLRPRREFERIDRIMRTSSMVCLSLITAILTVAGCMPDNSSNESGQTTGENVVIEGTSVQSDNVSGAGGTSVETDTMTTPEAPPKCERRGLSSPDKVVKRIANGLEYITEQTEESGTKDRLKITVFQSQDFIGPTAPGDYLLDGVNHRDCGLCAVIYAGIDPENPGEWQKTFYADRGTINFSDLEDGKLKGAFKDVVFYEVEINQADSHRRVLKG